MENEYELTTLVDIAKLEDDQIDRLCAELPAVLKQAKALGSLLEVLSEVEGLGPSSTSILEPMVWIDDGKTDVTMTLMCGDEELLVYKSSSSSD